MVGREIEANQTQFSNYASSGLTRARVLGLLTARTNLRRAQLDVALGILVRAVGLVDVGQRDFELDWTLHQLPVVLLFDCKKSF